MNKYNSYKDSGLEWIGEIPKHWKELPLRYYFDYTKGSNGQKLNKTYIEENKGEYPVYSGQTTKNGILGYVNEYEFDYSFPLVFTTTVGAKFMNTRILQGKFSLSQNCLVMIRKKICIPSYFQYLLSIDFEFRRELIPTIIQPSLRMEDLDRMTIIIPTLSEQQQIVSFLDDKTQKIDSLIQKKEKKIELLKEKRTSLINHVVTKGLDPNVKMKDSGVEWIGEIPSHWNTSKLKYHGNFFSGYSFDSNDFQNEGEVRVIKISNIQNNGVSWEDLSFLPKNYYDDFEGFRVLKGDLIFVLTRPIISTGIKVCFYQEEHLTLLNQRNSVFRPDVDTLVKRFLFFLVRTFYFFEEFKQQLKGSGQPNISTEQISNIKIYLPSLKEQQQIVEYLDKQTEEIDTLIQLEQKKIDTLKEYRQSLISEVVTGKIRVCEEDNSLILNSRTV